MAYLCNKHGLDRFYPTDPGERAMIDSANFYLIGTLYPLVARATYPVLGFPQYPGEVATSGADDDVKAKAHKDAEDALAEPLDAYRAVLPRREGASSAATPVDRRHPLRRDARVPQGDRLRVPGLGERVMSPSSRRSARRTPSRRATCAATSPPSRRRVDVTA